jgi:hypothetical protein
MKAPMTYAWSALLFLSRKQPGEKTLKRCPVEFSVFNEKMTSWDEQLLIPLQNELKLIEPGIRPAALKQ